MKKIIYTILVIPFLLISYSCSDDLDERWKNPNKHTPEPNEVIAGLFTHMQKTRYWLRDYGENYWMNSTTGSMFEIAQISTMWPYADSYIARFADYYYGDVTKYISTANGNNAAKYNRFYTDMTNYALISDEIELISGEELDNNIIFLKLATVLKNIIALQTVDLFNSIPYFEAFKGTKGIFFAPYDDPMEIYKAVIEENNSIAKELQSIYDNMSTGSQNTLKTQDIFFKGDINKWTQYINSQILKSSVRLAGVNAEFAKPYIAEAVKNLPKEDFTFESPTKNRVRIGSNGGSGIIHRAFYEKYYTLAVPDVIMTRMNRGEDIYELGIDDPRLPVITMGFSPDGTTNTVEYYGTSMNWDRNAYLRLTLKTGEGRKWNVYPQDNPQQYILNPSYSMDAMVQSCPWTYYNPITFVLNETPLYIMSLAEVDLYLAEATTKGLAETGKNAGQHINDAVKHSTDFWYFINQSPHYVDEMTDLAKAILTPDKPDASIIDGYAQVIQNDFDKASGVEDKMEIIMQQMYIHLNILQPFELFTDLRRTRHPKLEPVTSKGTDQHLVNATMMFERFKLPESELSTNFEQYSKVMQDDLYDKPIFWVPEGKRNETYFMDRAIKDPITK